MQVFNAGLLCNWRVNVLFGNYYTNLVSFPKEHIDKPVNSDGMF